MAILADVVRATLVSRQNADLSSDRDAPDGFVEENGRFVPFWHSRTGIIIKWSVFLGLFFLFTAYLLIGHIHAKKRMRKGLKPLAYHRWLVKRADLARVDPRYAYAAQPVGYNNYRPDYYGMQPMPGGAPPPPVYDPNAPRPPVYDQQPDGATKTAPSQWVNQPAYRPEDQDYQAPPGPPPPPAVTANHTGSSNPYRQ